MFNICQNRFQKVYCEKFDFYNHYKFRCVGLFFFREPLPVVLYAVCEEPYRLVAEVRLGWEKTTRHLVKTPGHQI